MKKRYKRAKGKRGRRAYSSRYQRAYLVGYDSHVFDCMMSDVMGNALKYDKHVTTYGEPFNLTERGPVVVDDQQVVEAMKVMVRKIGRGLSLLPMLPVEPLGHKLMEYIQIEHDVNESVGKAFKEALEMTPQRAAQLRREARDHMEANPYAQGMIHRYAMDVVIGGQCQDCSYYGEHPKDMKRAEGSELLDGLCVMTNECVSYDSTCQTFTRMRGSQQGNVKPSCGKEKRDEHTI